MRLSLLLPICLVVVASACSTDPVSNLNQTTPSNTHQGFQARFLGMSFQQKADYGTRVVALDGFARNAGNFTTTDPRYILEWVGDGVPIPNSDFYGGTNWIPDFNSIDQAQALLRALPNASPAYSAGDLAKIKGEVYTMEALDYMQAALTRDTLGVPVQGPLEANPNTAAPILCTRDVWQFIVALLDSGEAQLNVDTSAGLPLPPEPGFSYVAGRASPSTVPSFAAFNRALAARANLELAYGIARSPGGTPSTPTSAGAPDHNALVRADSALHASALYNPNALVPAAGGNFSENIAVYHSFSGTSGDISNPMQTFTPTYYVLLEAIADIDPSDLRLAKLELNPSGAATTTGSSEASPYTYTMYLSPTSPMPVVRNEELNLVEAQIRLGLGDLSGAVAAINAVRTKVGGLAPVSPATYATVRDQILKEMRASLMGEPGGDRVAAIRDYGLPAVADTTWGASDTHATVQPFPVADATARNNNTAYTCS